MRALIGLLLLANVAMAVVAFHPFGGSAEDLARQQAAKEAQLAALNARIRNTRQLVDKVEVARQAVDGFLDKYFMDRRTTTSDIWSELQRIAAESGVELEQGTFQLEDIEGSDTIKHDGRAGGLRGQLSEPDEIREHAGQVAALPDYREHPRRARAERPESERDVQNRHLHHRPGGRRLMRLAPPMWGRLAACGRLSTGLSGFPSAPPAEAPGSRSAVAAGCRLAACLASRHRRNQARWDSLDSAGRLTTRADELRSPGRLTTGRRLPTRPT